MQKIAQNISLIFEGISTKKNVKLIQKKKVLSSTTAYNHA